MPCPRAGRARWDQHRRAVRGRHLPGGRRATEVELTRVHNPSYLSSLREFSASGGGAVDFDTHVSLGTWDTALLAAGGVLATMDALASGIGDVAFVAARPPGHHALANKAMGFCFFNNIAIGAAELADRGEPRLHPRLGRPSWKWNSVDLLG